MDYNTFKTKIADNEVIPDYYFQLYKHRTDISKDIKASTQYKVAQQLNLQPIKLSHIMQVLDNIPALNMVAEHLDDITTIYSNIIVEQDNNALTCGDHIVPANSINDLKQVFDIEPLDNNTYLVIDQDAWIAFMKGKTND